MLGGLAHGRTEIRSALKSADCLATAAALRTLGVPIADGSDGTFVVEGAGPEALREPEELLDAGNSGTTLRLISGLVAGRPFLSLLTGDASLRQRPMRRIVAPLSAMGATILGRAGGEYPPLAVRGGDLSGIAWTSPVASAQVKSAILLAGVQAKGETSVTEPILSRDHTERMLEGFGVAVRRRGTTVAVAGGSRLTATRLVVPADPSSAAFFLVAAAAWPGAEISLPGVGVNPTRTGLLEVLERMGASITRLGAREEGGEPVADLLVRGASLRGTRVEAALIPCMIDEIPALAVAAALAAGDTVVEGVGELRVKEVDRLEALQGELGRLGATVSVEGDTLGIRGGSRLRGARVESRGDHRMAMSLAVAGLFAEGETTVQDVGCADTSFPGFAEALRTVAPGCGLREVGRDG
jgi:3-phosphoshikimate 1-carboxyvinyltransferase